MTLTVKEQRELVDQCISKIRSYIDLGNEKLGTHVPYPRVEFNIKGTCAGYAYYSQNMIRLNPTLLFENGVKFVERTPGHEVAHLLCRAKYGAAAKSHGSEWKSVMWTLGLDSKRCHSFNVSNVPTRRNKVSISVPCSGPSSCNTRVVDLGDL